MTARSATGGTFQWSDQGAAFHPVQQGRLALSRLPSEFGDPLATTNPHAVVVRWRELSALSAVDPWPRIRVVWKWGRDQGVDELTLKPDFMAAPDHFAEEVARLLDVAERHRPDAIEWGWAKAPEVNWERVSEMPDDTEVPAGAGAYRMTRVRHGERVVARREAPSSLETLLHWLASGPDRRFADHPREVVMTGTHLYVCRRDRQTWRLPLSALRTVLADDDGDALFLFGRRTGLILPHRPDCPVRAALNRKLTERLSPSDDLGGEPGEARRGGSASDPSLKD